MAQTSTWRSHTAAPFVCDKRPATAAGGMVVTNHALASAAGAEMLTAGGNAVDAAIAALFTLTVVEPMMVGILGGGMTHIRTADGRHRVIDGVSTAPLAGRADMFRPISDRLPDYLETEGRENAVGPKSVAAAGNLMAWEQAIREHGTLPLADVMEPAIRHAARGFRVTPYLSECIAESAVDMARDSEIAALYLPGGKPLSAGSRLVQADYAATLGMIARDGIATFYRGDLMRRITAHFARVGGVLAEGDFTDYRTIVREPVRGTYRDVEIVGPPLPSAGGVHVIQMLNILEGFDISGLGYGSTRHLHLLAEALKIAFADRRHATGDPAFVAVPTERLLSKDYARERRERIDLARSQNWGTGLTSREGAHTTHVTVADRHGNVVAATHTINSLFGARFIIPGTGIIPNNYMHVFDPHPGTAQSIAPGKRLTTSMAPLIGLRDGRLAFALGLPGGLRIFGSAMQAVVNLVDHGMSVQEAVEAPRVWTQGDVVEIETGIPQRIREELQEMGHKMVALPHVGGGMNAITFAPDGTMTGAACWRADGAPVGVGGGYARSGVRFWPDQRSVS